MKKYWRLYLQKFEKLTVRERVLVYATAAVVVIFIADALFLGPLTQRRSSMSAQVESQRQEIENIEQQLVEMRQRRDADPDAASKQRIEQINKQIGEIDQNLKQVQDTLVPPEKMADLLQELVTKNKRLQLVGLKTIPGAPLIDRAKRAEEEKAKAAALALETRVDPGEEGAAVALPVAEVKAVAPAVETQPEANIFKHGVEITLRGSYPDFVLYLEQLERLPWQMYWGGLKVDAENYPQVTMVLVLYTLSLDQAWLKI
jgi:MSHA biogenesis protein MshJ